MTTTPLSQADATEPVKTYVSLTEALSRLDPENDDHWTNAGLPAMDAVNADLQHPITRADLDKAFPNVNRDEWRERVTAADAILAQAKETRKAAVSTSAGEREGDGAHAIAPDGGLGLAPIKTEGGEGAVGLGLGDADPRDTRIAALEADLAFLRKTFGWPTKKT